MQMQNSIIVTTCPTKKEAKALASLLRENNVTKCVQINKIKSYYMWDQKLHKDREFRLMIKSKKSHFKRIEKLIKENHSYDLAQIIEIPITDGSKEYLDWLNSSIF